MLAPVMLVMTALVFYPLVRGIMLSFTDADRFSIGNKYVPSSYHYVGIRNYKSILTGSDFRSVAVVGGSIGVGPEQKFERRRDDVGPTLAARRMTAP